MRLDQLSAGRNKYALIKMRGLTINMDHCNVCGSTHKNHFKSGATYPFEEPTHISIPLSKVDFGEGDNAFFAVRLKDRFSGGAFRGYYEAIREYCANYKMSDEERASLTEYAKDILHLLEVSRDMERKIPD